jgi:hypothetical protein
MGGKKEKVHDWEKIKCCRKGLPFFPFLNCFYTWKEAKKNCFHRWGIREENDIYSMGY